MSEGKVSHYPGKARSIFCLIVLDHFLYLLNYYKSRCRITAISMLAECHILSDNGSCSLTIGEFTK